MPELPSAAEVMAKEPPDLPSNIVKGQDISKQDYLGIQYKLYRYEGVEHLRRAVAVYASGDEAWKQQAFVYTQVNIPQFSSSSLRRPITNTYRCAAEATSSAGPGLPAGFRSRLSCQKQGCCGTPWTPDV